MKPTSVVLIHGARLPGSCWNGWAGHFTAHGFDVTVSDWRDLDDLALVEHHEKLVRSFDRPPVLIGHELGGLLAQQLLGAGLAAAAIAIAPTPLGEREIVVDTANAARGPLLLVSGQEDRIVPDAATRATYKLYGDSTAGTDLKQFPDRGHTLIVDDGWRAVADSVLMWLAAKGITARI